jgi:hypothetical protein
MRDKINFIALLLLCQIVQKEIDQNGIDLRIRFELQNLAPQQLDGPDTASAYLHLPGMSGFDELEAAQRRFKGRAVPEHAEGVQHLGDAIVYRRVSGECFVQEE